MKPKEPVSNIKVAPVTDTIDRPLQDLRISVTDRCNFRCVYCMPKEIFGRDYQFLAREDLLSFEEITRLAKLFVGLGVRKIRLTGGEPLLRREIEHLIASLAEIHDLEDLTLTTNGTLLAEKAEQLKQAGLRRLTVSLDSLDDAVFSALNDIDFPVKKVLDGIEEASRAGLSPIKINMVVKRGLNEADVLPMARHFKDSGHILRFIEFMDVGSSNGWRLDDVVPSSEIVDKIHREMPIEPVDPNYRGEVANRYRYIDGVGEIGLISSVTQPFCTNCTRVRLSAEGKLFTCLFAIYGHDLRKMLRDHETDEMISNVIGSIWQNRGDRYSEIRSAETVDLPKVEMSYIGG